MLSSDLESNEMDPLEEGMEEVCRRRAEELAL